MGSPLSQWLIQSRSPFNQQVRELATKAGIDIDSRSWKRYYDRCMEPKGGVSSPLEWLVHELRALNEGEARLIMTPDGVMTILYGKA